MLCMYYSGNKFYEDDHYGSMSPIRRTEGLADTLSASDNGQIEHIGDAARVLASHGGKVMLRGIALEEVYTTDNGSVYCQGSPRLVSADHLGSITIGGDPLDVRASDNGDVVVFGTPGKVRAMNSGHVTIVTPKELGPDVVLQTQDNGTIHIISPGDKPARPTTQYLKRQLDELFPDSESSPSYAAFATLLERNRDKYLFE